MNGDPIPFIRAAFKAYWADQADLEDQAVVAQIFDDCGCEQPDWPDAFEKLAIIRGEGEEQKVFETPTYLIDSQIFLGREHLPWIKSIIVAN